MITNYSFVMGESFSAHGALVELTKEVRSVMEHGWQPLGAPLDLGTETHRGATNRVFCQAIVKTTEDALREASESHHDANSQTH